MDKVDKKPRATNWLSAALILVALYPLSIGPACWVVMRLDPWKHQVPLHVIVYAYDPMARAIMASPPPLRSLAEAYLRMGAPGHVSDIYVTNNYIVWHTPGHSFTFISI